MKFTLEEEDLDGNPKLTWVAKGIVIAILLPAIIAVFALNSGASWL